VVGQLLVGPVGPAQALPGRPLDYPATDLVGHRGGDAAGTALGFPGQQAVEAAFAVGVEPTGDADPVDAQVRGDVLAGPTTVGHQDDLEAVSQFPALGGAEESFQAVGLAGWQLDADHAGFLLGLVFHLLSS